MSLDGFVTAPHVSLEHPLGEGGLRLHDWLFKGAGDEGNTVDRQVAGEFFATTGAFVIGRRTFDLGVEAWGDDGTFGKPCFVLTSRPRETLVKGATTFNFVTDGVQSSFEQARAAAGDRDVCVMGGADVARQYVKAGLVDELRIHIAHVLLGAGTRLFEPMDIGQVTLEQTRVLESPFATHLRFRVIH